MNAGTGRWKNGDKIDWRSNKMGMRMYVRG